MQTLHALRRQSLQSPLRPLTLAEVEKIRPMEKQTFFYQPAATSTGTRPPGFSIPVIITDVESMAEPQRQITMTVQAPLLFETESNLHEFEELIYDYTKKENLFSRSKGQKTKGAGAFVTESSLYWDNVFLNDSESANKD